MKKWLCVLLTVCLACFCVFGFAACKEDETPETIDISGMKISVAYAEAYKIETSPAEYEGKVLVIKGTFSNGNVTENGKDNHHLVNVNYDENCCRSKIAFKWDGDLPTKEGAKITVKGVIKVKKEKGHSYPEIQAESVKF